MADSFNSPTESTCAAKILVNYALLIKSACEALIAQNCATKKA